MCDLDTARAEAVLGDRSGVDVTGSLDELLARDDIDAIAIATPARTHQPIALQALRAGKHVLVEKPLADSVAAGQDMVDLAREPGAHADGGPHLLLHAGGPEDPRAGRARARSARSSSSTRCASTSG